LQQTLAEALGRGGYCEREVIVECGDESQLAPVLSQVASRNPEVYLKSRASHFGADVKFRILLSASGESEEEASGMIERAASDLTVQLNEARLSAVS
jgi:molybdopterin-biosynthesis enzyme MoeA-like protein